MDYCGIKTEKIDLMNSECNALGVEAEPTTSEGRMGTSQKDLRHWGTEFCQKIVRGLFLIINQIQIFNFIESIISCYQRNT